MTTLPPEWVPRAPETLEEAMAENQRLRQLLGALAAHAPTVLELARAANIIGARRHDGTLHAFEYDVLNARRFMRDTKRERQKTERRVKPRSAQ